MGPAASLAVLVQVKGLSEASRGLRSVDTDLRKAAATAGTASRDLEATGKRGSKALGLLKGAAGALGGVVAFGALSKGVGMAVDEFEEARKVGALTENVIKSTGGAANVTAAQVAELAGSISKKVGIDDEAIQSGANLLLTFKNVRNETGKGRDIFNQATAAAVDLSAAGFGSLESTSKQLGKALNDPIKGMTALGRSGVTFSEDQKKAITALVETGKATDRVKAQQMILKEVNSQVGGAAAAQASSMDKLKVTLGNLAEAAGAVLVPALDKGARFMSSLINGMIEGKGAGGAIISVFRTTGGVIGTVVTAVSALVGWFKQHTTVTLALGAAIGTLVAAFAAMKILAAVQAAIVAVRAAMIALNLAFLANPVFLVVAILAALAAAFVVAYRESETFRRIVDAAWAAIKDAAEAAWKVIKGVVGGIVGFFKDIESVGKRVVGALTDGIKGAPGVIADAAGWVKNRIVDGIQLYLTPYRMIGGFVINRLVEGVKAVTGLAGDVGGWVKNRIVEGVQFYVSAFKGVGGWVVNRLEEGVKSVGGFANDVGGWVKNRVVDGIMFYVEGLKTVGGWIVNRVEDGIKAVAGFAMDVGGWVKNRIVEGIMFYADGIKQVGSWVVNRVADGFTTLTDTLAGIGGWLKNRIVELVHNAAESFASLGGWILGRLMDGITGFPKRIVEAIGTLKSQVVSAVKNVFKDAISIPLKLKLPSINLPFGGAGGGNVGPGKGRMPSGVDGFNDDAAKYGNVVTSALRPGDPGYHGMNRARDYAGGNMLGFAKYMAANFGGRLTELIHTPLGYGIKNGKQVGLGYWGQAVNADHYDHVHVALQNGGRIKSGGWAMVGEQGPELVKLPSRSSVYPAGQTQAMLGGQGSSGPVVHIEHMEVHDRFDEQRVAADIAWKVLAA